MLLFSLSLLIVFYLLYLVLFVSGKSLQATKSDVIIIYKAKQVIDSFWLDWTLFSKGRLFLAGAVREGFLEEERLELDIDRWIKLERSKKKEEI